MGVISCRSREAFPTYIRAKASAKCYSSSLGAKTRGRKKAVPGVGEKAGQLYIKSKTIPLASVAPLQQLERVGRG